MKQQSQDTHLAQSDRLAAIWAIVEARKTFPATIVVTSATLADDTETIARGLAQAAHDAGQRTGYLYLSHRAPLDVSVGPYVALTMDPRPLKREAFNLASAQWRTTFDVVIIDAPQLRSQILGAHVARVADGIVLGVCDQRRVVPADRELATLLAELDASLIGAVLTARMVRPDSPARSKERASLEVAAHRT